MFNKKTYFTSQQNNFMLFLLDLRIHRPVGLRNSIYLSWLDFADMESPGTDFP